MEQSLPSSSKPLVVLLHPHCYSFRDMQFYVPLLREFDILAVTFRRRPETRTFDGLAQAPLLSLDQVVGAVPLVQTVLDKALRLRSENLYYFWGLDECLRRAAIVECLETFHPYCWQALQGKARYGYKLAFSVHENIAFAHENLGFRRKLKQDVFREGDAFFALCEQGRNSLVLEGAPANKIHLSGMSVDTDLYCPGEPGADLDALHLPHEPGETRLLFAGRLVYEKGIFDAVEAVGLLHPDLPTRLYIAGDGPEAGAVRERITRMGLKDRVHLLGRVSREQMIALYRWADLCLAPSIPTRKWQEQFGCVLIEALACGCPVIATDTGAIREVLNGHGALVAPNQHTQLADTVRWLARDPARRRAMSEGGRDWVVRQYDNQVNAERIARVYRGLLGAGVIK